MFSRCRAQLMRGWFAAYDGQHPPEALSASVFNSQFIGFLFLLAYVLFAFLIDCVLTDRPLEKADQADV